MANTDLIKEQKEIVLKRGICIFQLEELKFFIGSIFKLLCLNIGL